VLEIPCGPAACRPVGALPARLLVPLLLIVYVDRHELVVVGLPLVNRLQVGSKG
jgi:hypothetical protein